MSQATENEPQRVIFKVPAELHRKGKARIGDEGTTFQDVMGRLFAEWLAGALPDSEHRSQRVAITSNLHSTKHQEWIGKLIRVLNSGDDTQIKTVCTLIELYAGVQKRKRLLKRTVIVRKLSITRNARGCMRVAAKFKGVYGASLYGVSLIPRDRTTRTCYVDRIPQPNADASPADGGTGSLPCGAHGSWGSRGIRGAPSRDKAAIEGRENDVTHRNKLISLAMTPQINLHQPPQTELESNCR